MSKQKTFHLGICMAGAISAGAYTAGVIDYLLEALEHWQKAKELQEKGELKNIPKHNVVIDVLSGASAGGMTAALTSALIHTDFKHVYKEDVESTNSEKLNQNPLYHSWVNLTETAGNDMMNVMLSTDDVENCKEARSLFNSDFIKTIAERHIGNTVKDPDVKRPYFADDLEVVATLTNLRGIPFEVEFKTSSYKRMHRMKRHFDLAHFRLKPDGKYDGDGRIPLHFENKEGCNKDILVQSAMATGGFPVGLEPRVIKRLGEYIIKNEYLNLGGKKLRTIKSNKIYETLNVDGGTINNDPFELTQNLLDEKLKVKESGGRKTDAKDFVSAVMMIDPFPNDSDLPEVDYTPLKAFKSALPKIFSAMIGELRMKEDVLKSAYGTDDYTKFLIIPSRSGANKEKENHIACGSFGGFGGFFSKGFREHDFLLGRRNCQQFLKKYFSVPVSEGNPILKHGYSGIEDLYKVGIKDKKTDQVIYYLPIIPDIRVIKNEETGKYSLKEAGTFEAEKYPYPEIKLSYLRGLKESLKRRIAILITNINNPKEENSKNEIVKRIRKKKWYRKLGSEIISKVLTRAAIKYAKGMLANKFIDSVIADMDDNELLLDDEK